MEYPSKNVEKEIREVKKELKELKLILKEDFELSDWAKKRLKSYEEEKETLTVSQKEIEKEFLE